jgi:shikimate dehydrogenase
MKLALIGKGIAHSASPSIYKKLLGPQIQYDLLDIQDGTQLPLLRDLARSYDGINITSPFKKNYLSQLNFLSPEVHSLEAVNTILLKKNYFSGANTDYFAVETLLKKFKEDYPQSHLLLLGSGVMAKLTQFVCQKLSLEILQITRSTNPHMEHLDIRPYHRMNSQLMVINACSREFSFKGKTTGDEIFWDYNYRFLPHQKTLPFFFKVYSDGQEMLNLQAEYAVKFWKENLG